MTAENDLRLRLHNAGTGEWIRRIRLLPEKDARDEMLRISQLCVDALDWLDRSNAAPLVCKEHEQFRHQHRDCDRLAVALQQIKLGPPITLANNEVAAWAASIANEAFALKTQNVTPVCIHGFGIGSEAIHDTYCEECQRVTHDTTVRLIRRDIAAECIARACTEEKPPRCMFGGSYGQCELQEGHDGRHRITAMKTTALPVVVPDAVLAQAESLPGQ